MNRSTLAIMLIILAAFSSVYLIRPVASVVDCQLIIVMNAHGTFTITAEGGGVLLLWPLGLVDAIGPLIAGGLYPCGSEQQVSIGSDGFSNSSGTRYTVGNIEGTGTGSYSGSENPFTVTMNDDITESVNWRTQYAVTFASSGLNPSVGTAVVVTVNGLAKLYSDLPFTGWYDGSVTYSYSTPVVGAASYDWVRTDGLGQTLLSNMFTVTGSGIITGTYSPRPGGYSSSVSTTTVLLPVYTPSFSTGTPFGSSLPSGLSSMLSLSWLNNSPYGLPNWILVLGGIFILFFLVARDRDKKKR